jgi:TRAP-type transport system periplasmic protein
MFSRGSHSDARRAHGVRPPANAYRRRSFLFGTVFATQAFAIVRAPARAAQFEYKLAHSQTIEHPEHVRLTQLSTQVARETNGRLLIHIFPNGQLGGQESMAAQVRLGAIQFCVIGDANYSGIIPTAAIGSIAFAFKDPKAAWAVMNGPVGDYLRKEFEAKSLYIPKGAFIDLGMREITSSTKPIRTVNDLAGFKIRVAPGNIYVDLFRTLGASPVVMDQNSVYPGLQTHIIDGQETPYLVIETTRLYEVQKYLSVSNHIWTGNSFVANMEAWKALPADMQSIVERNAAHYSGLEREDSLRLNNALADKLQRQGLTFNTTDTATMRSRLGPFYARWKNELGGTLWGLLEDGVGKLG